MSLYSFDVVLQSFKLFWHTFIYLVVEIAQTRW